MKKNSISDNDVLTIAQHSYVTPERLKKYYQLFCEYQVNLDKIHGSISSGDYNELQVNVHRIRGGAAVIGAGLLLKCAADIEDAIERERFDQLTDLVQNLDDKYKLTSNTFVKLLDADV